MKTTRLFVLFFVGCFLLTAQAQTASEAPKLQHFDPNQADRSLDPCQDFYKFACSKWFAANPIPPDQFYWDTSGELEKWNETVLRETMEKASSATPDRTPVQQKVGDFWAACIDEKAVNEAGTRDLAPELRRIDALQSKSALADEVAHLHMT